MTNIVLIGMVFVLAVMLGYAVSYYTPVEQQGSNFNWGGEPCYFEKYVAINNFTVPLVINRCNV